MGFVMKTWSNPITLDSNNLNRIEQGIKNSHDTLEIVSEEVYNLQNRQAEITKELETVTKDAPSILETLNSINSLLQNNDITTILKNADSFLTKTKQTLTDIELKQIYSNLGLDKFLKLTDIRVNNSSIINGSVVNITLPTIDTALNINSHNAISNNAVVKALQNIQVDVEVPTHLADLIQDAQHQTVSAAEKARWNSNPGSSGGIANETDPTVPAWAKQPTKPFYDYTEILNTPTIPTNNNQLTNGAGYITDAVANIIAENQIKEFEQITITPINNKLSSLENTDNTLIALLGNKAPVDHTHNNYVLLTNYNTKLLELEDLINSKANAIILRRWS